MNWLNILGITIDLIGFICISWSIIFSPKGDDVIHSVDRSGKRHQIEKPLFNSQRAKIGFCLVILGYIIQILSNFCEKKLVL
jgi:hypothetical protein